MKFAALAEIAEQLRGVTYGKSDLGDAAADGYLPVLRANNITNDGLMFDNLVYVKANKVSDRQRLKLGDIVIAASSGSLSVVGKAAQLQSDWIGGFGAFCKVIRPGAKVHSQYLGHFFRTQNYRRLMSALAEGANINNLKNEHLDELQVPLPPLDEQKRIASILDQADDLRRKRQRAIDRLNQLGQAIFYEMFGDPLINPKEWPMNSLAPCLLDVSNGMTRRHKETNAGRDVVLRLRDVRDGWIEYTNLSRINLSEKESQKYKLKIGDILFIRVNGNPDYVGRCSVFSGFVEPVFYNDHIMRVRVDQSIILPQFLSFILNEPYGKRQISRHRKTSAGQHTINQDGLGAIDIPIPPISRQQDFIARMNALKSLQKIQTDGQGALHNLFTSLQHRAFRGEL